MVSDAQRRAYWIGGLGVTAVGIGLLFWAKEAKAASSSGASTGSTSSNPSTGANNCTWSTPATAPNDVYALAGQISNGTGPVQWAEGQTYGPVTMSDGNPWRFVMGTGLTSTTAPVHDVLAQVCT